MKNTIITIQGKDITKDHFENYDDFVSGYCNTAFALFSPYGFMRAIVASNLQEAIEIACDNDALGGLENDEYDPNHHSFMSANGKGIDLDYLTFVSFKLTVKGELI